MLKPLYRSMIRAFGRRYGYDVGYMLHMLDASPGVMRPFNALSTLSGYRKVTPVNAHLAARLLGALHEDCGPCVQLTVDMAREAGMPEDQIKAVLTGEDAAMSPDTELGYRFASTLLSQSDGLEAAREAVREAYGDAGVVELTLATQVIRLFPLVKAGLGYGKTCNRITIGDREVTVVKEAA